MNRLIIKIIVAAPNMLLLSYPVELSKRNISKTVVFLQTVKLLSYKVKKLGIITKHA